MDCRGVHHVHEALYVACHSASGEGRQSSFRGKPRHGGYGTDTPRRDALPPCHADVPLGAAAHQHARHAARLREGVRRGVRRLAGVEETPRRQDVRDHAELGRDLCDELRRSRQGRPTRVRRSADVAGHPVGFLATADPRRWRHVRGRRRLLRAGSGQGRKVPAPAAGLRGRSPGGLLRLPFGHEQRVRVPPGFLCRCEQPEAVGRADREDEDLPVAGRGQTDEVPGRFGRTGEHAPDQRRDRLRRTEETGRRRRAAPGRPGLDGHAGRTRHREGGTLSAGRTYAGHPRPRGEVGVPDEPRDRLR